MRISGRTYWPASFVVAVGTTPVSVFFAVTLAFAITAPDGSVTEPNIVASCANARNEPANSNKERIVIRRRVWLLKTTPILFARNDFTANLQKGFELAPETGTTNTNSENLH